jgi:hypothetical protein
MSSSSVSSLCFLTVVASNEKIPNFVLNWIKREQKLRRRENLQDDPRSGVLQPLEMQTLLQMSMKW